MFCGKCGAKNDNNSSFCGKCGAKLEPITSNTNNLSGQNIPNSFGTVAGEGILQKVMKNKKIVVAVLAIVVIAIVAFVVLRNKESALLGTWEERSFATSFRTYTYEAGEGDCFTLGKNGVIIDSDHFFGYEFAYTGSVDILSWSVEGDTLILRTEYGDVEYVPYKLSGRTLTLYFADERSAVLYKVK